MGITSREALYIVEIIYYVPALLVTLYVTKKHGYGRQLGWIYLVILGLLRLIGAGTGIAAIHDPTEGLIECSTITFSVGLSPLLLALLGILKRLSEGMKGQGIPPKIFRLSHIPIIVGLVLAITAGTKEYDPNPSTRNDGYTYAKIAIMLFLAGYLILVAITLITFGKQRHILEGERRLAVAALISLPFIAVRLIYSIITAFDHDASAFSIVSTSKTAVIVQSIMSTLMEFIVVGIYLAAGLFVRVIPRSMVKEGYVDPPKY
jgi:uncharacterized membrane protein (DUF485 family)